MKNFKSKGISLENMVGEGLPVKEKARKAYNQTIALLRQTSVTGGSRLYWRQ